MSNPNRRGAAKFLNSLPKIAFGTRSGAAAMDPPQPERSVKRASSGPPGMDAPSSCELSTQAAHCGCMTDLIPWVSTAATIIAACMTASNLGSRVTGYGFAVFTLGSIAWLATGLLTDQPALAWTNVVLTFLNGFGVWRWLGRQARVEEGGRAAAEASETTPGEPLFPVSMLLRAPVRCGRDEVGNCIDAMAGCGSGKLAYI